MSSVSYRREPGKIDSEYTVIGMTCEHCVRSVSTEIGKLPGVQAVEVDLATGAVRVHSDTAVGREQVAAAVDEAGYQLAKA